MTTPKDGPTLESTPRERLAGAQRALSTLGCALALWVGSWDRVQAAAEPAAAQPTYTNQREPKGPLSIHVVRIPRDQARFQLVAVHAGGRALGLSPLSEQAAGANPLGHPLAGINGDFYQREGAYAGDPRGLQIFEGDLVSAPVGSTSFWIDAAGEPHVTNTTSLLRVTWPDGSHSPLELNENRQPDAITLYTPTLGPTTRTRGGRELILEPKGETPWVPLRPGKVYQARVREVRETGNSRLAAGTMVLSLGPAVARRQPALAAGAELSISTETLPSLRGVKTAISGGPVLVRNGKRQRVGDADSDAYETSSMLERHPRSAIGWNQDFFFLVEVDGRQRGLSVGMTLNELSAYLVKLGCQDGMNLDGGGSATLWYDGKVRNLPCDGSERPIANALVVVQKAEKPDHTHAGTAQTTAPSE